MFKSRSRNRRKNLSASPWKKAKNMIFARTGTSRQTPLPVPEPDSTDWLVCPHDTTSGLGVKRGAEKKTPNKSPVNIF